MTLRSALGQGTTVEIRFPTVQALMITPALEGLHEEAMPLLSRLHDLRVLVVDDESETSQASATLLGLWRCDVRCAASAGQVRQILDKGFVPHLAIVDHRLQGETGFDVLLEIDAGAPGIATIMVTGDTSPQNLSLLAAAGRDVLHKPIEGIRLLQAMDSALKRTQDATQSI